jgi:hypothetical protein
MCVLAGKKAFSAGAPHDSRRRRIMKTVQLFAIGALMLGGVAFSGCDKKPETTPATSTSAVPTTAAAESAMDKTKDAAKTAGDKIEAGAKKAEGAASDALKDLKK